MAGGTAGPRQVANAAFQIVGSVHQVAGMFARAEPVEFDQVFPEWGDLDPTPPETDDQRQARLAAWFHRG